MLNPLPSLTLLRMISGARYSGVPHNVQVRPLTRFANPKSVTCDANEINVRYAVLSLSKGLNK